MVQLVGVASYEKKKFFLHALCTITLHFDPPFHPRYAPVASNKHTMLNGHSPWPLNYGTLFAIQQERKDLICLWALERELK